MHRLKYSFREITEYFIKIKVMTERNFPTVRTITGFC